MGRMRIPTELNLRGFVSPDYKSRLQSIAQQASPRSRITFLPPASPAEMVRLAADADIGLSTEESHPPSRDICLTNKIFAYLLAGIPQLLSRTKAQEEFAPKLGIAALLCDIQNCDDSASRLDEFLSDSARVTSARHAAWRLAREQFCWDIEKNKLLALIRSRLQVTPS
jgi:glycosyltransferase involved in cell wall biosynthesis